MSSAKDLETKLNDLIYKQTPPLSDAIKKALVKYLAWVDLIVGIFTLWAAYALWQWAHQVNTLVNSINRLYGVPTSFDNGLSFTVWVSLIVLTVEALLYLFAFPAARARQKKGWDFMYYALLLNIVYGIAAAFTDYGGIGSLIGSILASAVGLYFLFQIRSEYLGKTTHGTKPKTVSASKD